MSGNFSDEPICINSNEALNKLNNIADLFLVHNRLIVRAVDDSIVRVVGGRKQILRRARGYAPLPIVLPALNKNHKSSSLLAVGGQLKKAIARSKKENFVPYWHWQISCNDSGIL